MKSLILLKLESRESSIILTARSGRAALNHRLELLGFNFGKEEIDDIYHRFLLLADKKKDINDEDIRILAGVVFQGEKSTETRSSSGFMRKIINSCCNCWNKD